METLNASITSELKDFVRQKVASGRYANQSDVIRASLRALEREELAVDSATFDSLFDRPARELPAQEIHGLVRVQKELRKPRAR